LLAFFMVLRAQRALLAFFSHLVLLRVVADCLVQRLEDREGDT
jgi:hypothetical protein